MMNTEEQIEKLIREVVSGEPAPFRACAYFDSDLDCIRVIARDCSVLETRVNEALTVLEDMYCPEPGRKRYVGFTVKGASHFCHTYGLSLATPIRVSQLLDKMLTAFPDLAVQFFVNGIARELVRDENIEQVDVSGPLPEPA